MKKVEYSIYKIFLETGLDHWDGPFKTKAQALKVWRDTYKVEGRTQHFVVCKMTLEKVKTS